MNINKGVKGEKSTLLSAHKLTYNNYHLLSHDRLYFGVFVSDLLNCLSGYPIPKSNSQNRALLVPGIIVSDFNADNVFNSSE